MKTIKQKGPDCEITALAMILDEEVATLKAEIPHDSLDDWWAADQVKTAMHRKRGYHIQEMIDCCIRRGKALCPIDLLPRIAPSGHSTLWRLIGPEQMLAERFMNIILNKRGLLHGQTPSGYLHCVAWDGKMIHDPADGIIKPLNDFSISDCWILTDLESNHG